MNTSWKWSRRVASALLLSAILAGCSSGPKAPSPALQQQIEAAHSRADHESLVAYYTREAGATRAIAAEHRKLAKSYQGASMSGRGGGSITAHCNSIVGMYDGIAAEYDGPAADHQRLAEQARP